MALLDQAVAWGEARGMPAARWVEEGLFDAASIVDLIGGTLKGVGGARPPSCCSCSPSWPSSSSRWTPSRQAHAAFGDHVQPRWRYARIRLEVQRYLLMKSVVSLVMGVLSGLGVWVIGLDFPLLWGTLAFLFNYVPNIGPMLAAIPPLRCRW